VRKKNKPFDFVIHNLDFVIYYYILLLGPGPKLSSFPTAKLGKPHKPLPAKRSLLEERRKGEIGEARKSSIFLLNYGF
jgi:hypothetical protein